MKILIARPVDADGAALWDEAKRAVEARQQHPSRMRERAAIMEKLLANAPDDNTPTPGSPDACLCGKRVECACRMRLPVGDVETGSDDE